MYEELNISVLEKGGYAVQLGRTVPGSYCPFLAAFSDKDQLLSWLRINLEERSPDLVDRRPQPPAATPNKDLDDEIPF